MKMMNDETFLKFKVANTVSKLWKEIFQFHSFMHSFIHSFIHTYFFILISVNHIQLRAPLKQTTVYTVNITKSGQKTRKKKQTNRQCNYRLCNELLFFFFIKFNKKKNKNSYFFSLLFSLCTFFFFFFFVKPNIPIKCVHTYIRPYNAGIM